MLGTVKGALKARYATSALALLGAYGVYQFFAPVPVEIEPEKMRAADEAAALVAAAMPEDWREKKLLTVTFARDESGYVTQAVMRATRRLDKAELATPPARAKLASALGMEGEPDEAAVLKLAGEAGANLLMLGKVDELSLEGGVPRISLAVEVLDVKTASRLWEGAVSWQPGFLERTVGLIAPMKRAIGWILLVLLLPWAVLPLVRRVLKKESNAANTALLCVLFGLSVALAYVALAGELSGWAGAFFLVAVAFGFFYNAGVLNYLAGLKD